MPPADRLCASPGVDPAGLIARLTSRAPLSAAQLDLLGGVERLPLG